MRPDAATLTGPVAVAALLVVTGGGVFLGLGWRAPAASGGPCATVARAPATRDDAERAELRSLLAPGWLDERRAHDRVVELVAGAGARLPAHVAGVSSSQLAAVSPVWRALEHPAPLVRRCALDLVRHDDLQPAPPPTDMERRLLARRCDPALEPAPTTRLAALEALIHAAGPYSAASREAQALARDDTDPRVEALAIAWLPRDRWHRDAWWAAALFPALADDDAAVRRAAEATLRGLDRPDLGTLLADRIARAASDAERARLVEVAGVRMSHPWSVAACAPLHAALCDIAASATSPRASAAAWQALAASGHGFVHPAQRALIGRGIVPATAGPPPLDATWISGAGIGCGGGGSSYTSHTEYGLSCGHRALEPTVSRVRTATLDETTVRGAFGQLISRETRTKGCAARE